MVRETKGCELCQMDSSRQLIRTTGQELVSDGVHLFEHFINITYLVEIKMESVAEVLEIIIAI